MSDLHALTKVFELGKTESEIVEYLLQYGRVKAVELRKVLHLDRAPFYRALNTLTLQDLVVVRGSLRLQTVELQDLDSIQNHLDARQNEITSAKESLKDLAASMRELRDDRYHRDNVEIFSGEDAYLHSMLSILNGGGKLLRDITPDSATLYNMAGSEGKYRAIVREVKSARLKKKIAIQILFDNQAKNIDSLSGTSPKDLKESRRFDGNLRLECYLNTCGSRSLFYTKDATGSWGIVLKDPLITNLLNSLFDVLWQQSLPL